MKTLLQINTSIYAGDGQSTILAERFVSRWRQENPDGQVIIHDLAKDPVPHLDAASFDAFRAQPSERTSAQDAAVNYSDSLIAELRRADVIVLGLPMYNFGIPSTLKAYFDHVARAGITFRYTAEGPIGLLTGKMAIVTATRGGRYLNTGNDTQTPFIRNFLGFLGITDVRFVYAEGLAIDEDSRRAGLAQAEVQIDQLFSPYEAAA